MNTYLELIAFSLVIGIGATLVMDIYAVILKRFFNIPSLDFRIVGRWIGHFKEGVFSHKNILQAETIRYEGAIGWLAHYLIGISFAFLLLLIWGTEWAYHPTFGPAISIGLLTTIAPFFLMQPAFGFGIAASKTPNPNLARFRSLKAHAIYGIGLYVAALLLSMVLS
ncbi:Protein of unknown function [Pedobacter steynii]|uniref:DUF2938 domain-containing protein n=1 Tax=Pedobacter steynii TaxID=430522 RepID=A0A1G9RGV4_9SPHI|nr:DUF2938 domain-containing protein [Pedobacter steynii]NQX37762.1 DUF2938 domain-containing protein [Pedobacter steynii]SDM22401.1 Protein of unknown function [Pedobacter steynii]